MPRKVDDKKTKKALRKLRRAAERAKSEDGPGLTEWEEDFVEGVEERLTTYGSAFNDPDKGALDEALSARQKQIVRDLEKKSRAEKAKARAGDSEAKTDALSTKRLKPKSSFKSKTPPRRVRDINDDLPEVVKGDESEGPTEMKNPPAPRKNAAKPVFQVIEGGLSRATKSKRPRND